jgi:hypothetical protein
MRQDLYRQTELERKTEDGVELAIYWLPVDSRVKPGVEITLKGETERWTVSRQFLTLAKENLKTDWKVGGLE